MTGGITRIPHEVAAALGFYVYALRDPRDGNVFYVGKGVGDRINAHAREAGKDAASERAKLRRIHEIEADGATLDLLFLRTGLDEASAFIVEQAVIDAFAADGHPLTNLVRGHESGERGLASLDAVIAQYTATPTPAIPQPLVMFKINAGWRPDMNDTQIYEQTSGHWKVGPRARERARYALGVAYGVVRGAYRIHPGSWFVSEVPGDVGRWGFAGEPAPELAHTISTHVRDAFKPGSQNPYRQFLDGYPGSG